MQDHLRFFLHQVFHRRKQAAVYYIAPAANWSLDWDARYITRDLPRRGVEAHIRSSAEKLFGQVIHFGSLWDAYGHRNLNNLKYNHLVATIFHGDKNQPEFLEPFEALLQKEPMFSRFVVSCEIMEKRLIQIGFSANKVTRIPLGVDLSVFKKRGSAEKIDIRRELGIEEDAFVIGSFQKDGSGMDEGLEPKFIKGPDILLKTLEQVRGSKKIFVLLSGPARGYIKQGLERLGLPYKHVLLDDYLQIPKLYKACDMYLMTSREEGGPKGILEALACGIPLVATRVGMAPDVIVHESNGLLAQSEDVTGLAESVLKIAAHPQWAEQLAVNGLQTIKSYDWTLIAEHYYQQVYKPILDELN